MNTLVFQVGTAGHSLQWAGTLARALADVGAKVTLALPTEAPSSQSYAFHVAPHLSKINVDAWFDRTRAQLSAGKYALPILLECIRRTGAQRVYLPTADGIAQHCGIRRLLGRSLFPSGVAVEALIMNGSVAHPVSNLSRQAFARASFELAKRGGWERFYHLDPFVHEWEAKRGVSAAQRVLTMPEPLEAALGLSKTEARRKLGLDPEGYYVGMTGGLNERKGADVSLLGFAQARLPRDAHLFLCGHASDGVRRAAEQVKQMPHLANRVHFRDQLVSDVEMLTAMCALDLVLLPYRSDHKGSSGIASRAVVAGRPVLMTPGSWGEKMSHHFGIGFIAPLETAEDVARELETHREAALAWVPPAANSRFVEYNSIPNFAAHWTQGFCEIQGISPAPLRTWGWARGATAAQ